MDPVGLLMGCLRGQGAHIQHPERLGVACEVLGLLFQVLHVGHLDCRKVLSDQPAVEQGILPPLPRLLVPPAV